MIRRDGIVWRSAKGRTVILAAAAWKWWRGLAAEYRPPVSGIGESTAVSARGSVAEIHALKALTALVILAWFRKVQRPTNTVYV